MKLRIKNFRSLEDTGDIDIKPITILIGKNSSGKSSFLRTFPMLKQSTEEKTKSPILLYGNYIDFGSYKDIKPHNLKSENEKYELGFTLDEYFFEFLNRRNRGRRYVRYPLRKDFAVNYNLKFEENDKELIQISEIVFKFLTNQVVIKIDQKKNSTTSIVINGSNHFKADDNFRFIDDGGFFLEFLKEKKISSEYPQQFERVEQTIRKRILSILSKYCLRSTGEDTKWHIIQNVDLTDDDKITLEKIKI
ncbi:AAA family ATPase [Mucilaginibacter sp. RB4R14]|uniref:AAA family ATPase n=1 Tax=Mucilaginibacter aurantiaciroseus TaxID=2949308 RepID=UPI00209073BA|nr:AAA family ATPase [Mucilaginibacter aurantiaciroseus]MCO5936532.1 AAA family ATPase [Mucilaginibacter aurantiaciroseus]